MTNLLYKECQLRQFHPARAMDDGVSRVERATRWLPADDAVIGRRVSLAERGGEWEIISAPDPALPGCLVRRFDPTKIDAAD